MIRALIIAVLGVMASTIICSTSAAPRITEGEVLRGRFVQERHLKGFAAPLRSNGQFLLAPGRGLIWKTEKPFAVTTVITEGGLSQEVDGSQTLRMPAAKLPFLSRLYQMLGGALAGDWRALEGDFSLVRKGDDGGDWQLGLTPKNADDMAMPFSAITMNGDRFVNEVTLTKPNGDFDRLTFVDQVLSATSLTAEESLTLDSVGR